MISTDQILQHGGSPVSTAMLDQSNHSVYGKECCGCLRVKNTTEFRRDSSYREGVRDLCNLCESSPRLSMEEHTHRLKEDNYNSAAVRAQRWEHQLEYMEDDECRSGRMRHSSEIYGFLKKHAPSLYFMDGRIENDISIFRTYGVPQPGADGKTFAYLMYMPSGFMPEFSLIEYGPQDQPVRERRRGWRTVLLRMIKSGIVTEQQVDDRFGKATGPGAVPYNRQLQIHRSRNV